MDWEEEKDPRVCVNCTRGAQAYPNDICVACVYTLSLRRHWRPLTLKDQQDYQNYLIRTKRREPNHVQQEEEED